MSADEAGCSNQEVKTKVPCKMAEGTSCQTRPDTEGKNPHKPETPPISSYGLSNFNLLALNTTKIEKRRNLDQLKSRYTILKQSLKDGCASNHELISLHLILSACARRLDVEDEEEHFLEEILKIEPDNLNALADLCHYNKHIHCTTEAKEYEERFNVKVHDTVLRAKSIAEKAYAVAHDVHIHTRKYERYSESNKLYDEALKLVSHDDEKRAEMTEWYYVMGENCKRIYNIMVETECEVSNRIEVYDKATKYFYETLQSSNSELKCRAWSSLGTLFCKKPKLPRRQKYPEFVGSCDMLRAYYSEKPLECFDRALEEYQSMKVTVEYGWQCYRLKNTEKAMILLNDVIENNRDNPRLWYAYSRRSKINRLAYRDSLRKASSHADIVLDKEILKQAMFDSRKCVEMNQTALEYANLAEIYHMLGIDRNRKVVDKRAIRQALQYFRQAEDCQDGADRPDVHQRRALCLRDYQHHREAIEAFKRAIECENVNTNYNANFMYLMQMLFQQYRQHKEEHILGELTYFFKKGIDRYGCVNIDKLNEEYAAELLTLGEHLLDSNQLRYAKRCFSALKKYQDEEICRKAKELLKKTQEILRNPNHSKDSVKDENSGGNQRVDSCAQSAPSTVEAAASPVNEDNSTVRQSESSERLTLLLVEKDPQTDTFSITSPDGELTSTEHKEQLTRAYMETQIFKAFGQIDQKIHNKPAIPPALEKAKNECGKEYDFFPVFCKEDEEWIWFTLLPKLEEELEYKGCIPCRDLLAGREILDNISDAIESSVCTLLILSPKFFKDKMCVRSSHTALNIDDNVIPFVMEKYDECRESRHLASLEKVHYFEYMDWQQLKRSLHARMSSNQ